MRFIFVLCLLLGACAGADGPQGLEGVPGPRGAGGAAGVDGADGQDGVAGADGADGADGVDGTDGQDGADGDDGDDGADGADGVAVEVLEADTTWSGDVALPGSLYVPLGLTLTVLAGATISLLPGAGLFVDGVLDLQGAPGDEITVRNATSFTFGPLGVSIAGDADESAVHDVIFDGVDLVLEREAVAEVADVSFLDGGLTVRGRTSAFALRRADFSDDQGPDGARVWLRDVADATLEDVTIVGGDEGLLAQDVGGLSVEGGSFSQLRVGLWIEGDPDSRTLATVDGSTLTGFVFEGVRAQDTEITLSSVAIADAGADGLHHAGGGDLVLDTVTVTGAGDDCVDSNGGLWVAGSTLSACASDGIEGGSGIVVRTTSVVDAGANGLNAADGQVSSSSFSACGERGVLFDGEGSALVEQCDVFDNDAEGVKGRSTGTNLLTVTESNITGNREQGVREAMVVNGCYVADNNGEVGVDLVEASSGDAQIRSVDTAQMEDIATVGNAAAAPVPGTGP